MLAHILAVLLGFSSFVFYIAAFFYPEVHRRSDFLWSSLGMFYAVVLWFCAGQMTPTVTLAQVTAVTLLWGLGWQTLTVRREKTPVYQQTPVVLTPEVVGSWAKNKLNQLRIAPDETVRPLPTQNRSLSATAAERFRKDLDPRRRPVYDYEFVEDGILEDGILEEYLLGMPDESEPEETEVSDIIPPTAAAQVISENSPDSVAEAAEADSAEVILVPQETTITADEDTAKAAEAISTEAAESRVVALEAAKETIQTESPQPNTDHSEPLDPSAIVEPENDDWDLDIEDSWHGEPSVSASENTAKNAENTALLSKKKPSLLATPVILLGWVKDVISAMTKPKPSKPVIDIPRREPPASAKATSSESGPTEPTSTESISSEDQPPTNVSQSKTAGQEPIFEPPTDSSPAIDNSDNFDDDDNWEDSNWDD
ncbi:MAG: Ycf66 family protein [Cyanobacteria bacterium J06629_19]